jgi:predicted aldo/keto reductase-like oxidoreductase
MMEAFMQKRQLGRTEQMVSPIGVGGFHLLEIGDSDAVRIMNTFLDEGGNYIETAAQYGEGESERKIGLVMKSRRDDCFLTTKCHFRDRQGAARCIDQSLRRLHTDHVDLLIFHHVATDDVLDQILGPDGALEAFTEAREGGKIRYIGISGHGVPDVLIRALSEYHFDAVMTGFNFYDRFNFPAVEETLIPLAKKTGTGIVGMKAFGDGLLWEYPEESIRYALSLPLDVLPLGFNTLEQLQVDLKVVRDFKPLTDREKEEIFTHNPILGNYVCRLCGECLPCPEGIDIPRIFNYEGWYDRQLRDQVIRSTPDFALRDRVRFWFDDVERARTEYDRLQVKADRCTDCAVCVPKCPYKIDIIAKLKLTHFKMTRENIVSIPISG